MERLFFFSKQFWHLQPGKEIMNDDIEDDSQQIQHPKAPIMNERDTDEIKGPTDRPFGRRLGLGCAENFPHPKRQR